MMVDEGIEIQEDGEEKNPSLREDGSDDPEEARDPELAKGDSPEFKWYIARTLTGHEKKVVKALRESVITAKQGEFFAEITVPEEEVVSNAGGKKRTLKKKFFPGYILIKMIMSENTWHLVKNVDKIAGFVGGTPSRPSPITDEEAAYMTNRSGQGLRKAKSGSLFQEGEQVKVIEGPFASFVGTVETVNDKGKVKVNVSIFGRPTPVELDFSQVEKVS